MSRPLLAVISDARRPACSESGRRRTPSGSGRLRSGGAPRSVSSRLLIQGPVVITCHYIVIEETPQNKLLPCALYLDHSTTP